MKKRGLYLLLFFTLCFPAIPSAGQDDSPGKALTGEVITKSDNKEIAENATAGKPKKGLIPKAQEGYQPTAVGITVWIFMSWSFFLILISIPFYFNHKKIKERQVTLKHLIEKGHDIPKELLVPSSRQGRSDLHKGMVLIALGLGILIVLLSLRIPNNYWTIGLIPTLIGVAYLVSFRLDKPAK